DNSAALGVLGTFLSPLCSHLIIRLPPRLFSSQAFALVRFSNSLVISCAPRPSLRTPLHRSFPQLNLHRARVRRNPERPRSNGFIARAQSTLLTSDFSLSARIR